MSNLNVVRFFIISEAQEEMARNKSIPAWVMGTNSSPVHFHHEDVQILDDASAPSKSGVPVRVRLVLLPEVNIEGGIVVTYHEDKSPTVVKHEGERECVTLNPNHWREVAFEHIKDGWHAVVIEATATMPFENKFIVWEITDLLISSKAIHVS